MPETPTLPVVALVLAALLVAMLVEAIGAPVTAAGLPLLGDLLTLQLSVEIFYFPPSRAYITQQAPNPSNVLGVFGLSIRTQERDLDEEFSRFGRVEKVTIVYDQRVSFIICLFPRSQLTFYGAVRPFPWVRFHQNGNG